MVGGFEPLDLEDRINGKPPTAKHQTTGLQAAKLEVAANRRKESTARGPRKDELPPK